MKSLKTVVFSTVQLHTYHIIIIVERRYQIRTNTTHKGLDNGY